MTPNPKNIGAAPEEYRDLVPGEIILATDETWSRGMGPWETSYGSLGEAYDTDIHWPHRRRIPSPDAVGVPEAKPKGPSIIFGHPNEKPYQYHFNPDPDAIVQAPEVTQPGEGVEALDILGAIKLDIGMAEWGSHEDGAAMYREFIDTWYPRIKKLLAKAGRAA
jgi:hypothetical protein